MKAIIPQNQDILKLAEEFVSLTQNLTQNQKELALVLMDDLKNQHKSYERIKKDWIVANSQRG